MLLVVYVRLPVTGVVKMQGHTLPLFGPDMLRDEVCVVQQFLRLAEGVGIHPLHDVVFQGAVRPAVGDLVGLVHVAGLDLLIAHIDAFNAEGLSDFLEFLIHFHEMGPPSLCWVLTFRF